MWKSSKKFNVAVSRINIFLYVCFAEEVILADDENENDYDGINSLFSLFCVCVCMNVLFFLKYQWM